MSCFLFTFQNCAHSTSCRPKSRARRSFCATPPLSISSFRRCSLTQNVKYVFAKNKNVLQCAFVALPGPHLQLVTRTKTGFNTNAAKRDPSKRAPHLAPHGQLALPQPTPVDVDVGADDFTASRPVFFSSVPTVGRRTHTLLRCEIRICEQFLINPRNRTRRNLQRSVALRELLCDAGLLPGRDAPKNPPKKSIQ